MCTENIKIKIQQISFQRLSFTYPRYVFEFTWFFLDNISVFLINFINTLSIVSKLMSVQKKKKKKISPWSNFLIPFNLFSNSTN